MKNLILKLTLFSWITMLAACGQKSHEHDHEHSDDHQHEHTEMGPNEALYEEVMKVHNEVMPKMDDLYKLKQEIKKKIADTPNLTADKKIELEGVIAKLDSAHRSMMVWMNEFKPLADSVAGEEKAREYLENEMEKVKKMRDDVLGAIEKGEKSK